MRGGGMMTSFLLLARSMRMFVYVKGKRSSSIVLPFCVLLTIQCMLTCPPFPPFSRVSRCWGGSGDFARGVMLQAAYSR